jgi:hypothetical protein
MKAFILFVAQLGILGSLEARDCFFENKHFKEENFITLARFYPVADSIRTIIILPPTGGGRYCWFD